MGSALGVPRYIYFKLATFFAEHHFNVLCFDYRGIHESKKSNIPGSEIRMYDWGNRDINAALEWSIENWASDKLIYIGHSCGGQLLGLANHASKIDAAIFIASQSGYWKLWPFPHKLGVWSVWQLIPLITPWFDDFPARALQLSSTNIPSGVARQWAQWGKSKDYLWAFISEEDRRQYLNLQFPLLSLGFTDDQYFGPPAAVKKLLEYYPSTEQQLRLITPESLNRKSIGHFGFLKSDLRNTLWQQLIGWIQKLNL